MSDIFNREHEVIKAGTFHNAKGENTMCETFRQPDEVIKAGTFHDMEGEIITMDNIFNKEHEIIEAGTFHNTKGDNKMTNMILIHKEAGTKKDAVRVTKESNIPDFLKDAIKIVDGRIQMQCVEGTETADFGAVIGYEITENTPSGYNCWVIGNASTNLVEKNGVFYKKATVMKAQLVEEDKIPDFLQGAEVRKNKDGSWTIKTSWGESTGFPGECYWVLYGTNEDGTPDANILTKTEKSFKDYLVCDEDGEDLCWLAELDEALNTGKIYILSPNHKRVKVTKEGVRLDRY